MDRTLHVLAIAPDASFVEELERALSELPEVRFVLDAERDPRRGVEVARDRQPDVVCLEMGADPAAVRSVASDVAAGSPGSLVVAAYRPQDMGQDERSAAVLIDVMRASVRDFLRRPVSADEVAGILRRHFEAAASRRAGMGRITCVLSNKGGVGKTTLATNLACDLARSAPDRVLLVDGSLQQGACAALLDLSPETSIVDAARELERLDERLLRSLTLPHESGLRLLAAPENAVAGAAVDDLALSRVLSVARRAFDHVVVDTFPLIDAVTVAILDVADVVLLVVNDMVPTVIGAVELLDVVGRLGVPSDRVHVVLNRNQPGFRGRLRAVDVATRLDRGIDAVLPYRRSVLSSMNTGVPHVMQARPWSGFRRSLRRLERDLILGRAPQAVAPPEPSASDAAVEGVVP